MQDFDLFNINSLGRRIIMFLKAYFLVHNFQGEMRSLLQWSVFGILSSFLNISDGKMEISASQLSQLRTV